MKHLRLGQGLDQQDVQDLPGLVGQALFSLEKAGLASILDKDLGRVKDWCSALVLPSGVRVVALEFDSSGAPKVGDSLRLEAHRVNIDIHICLGGMERIAVGPTQKLEMREDYDKDNDVEFGQVKVTQVFDLGALDALILNPEDAHMPKFSPKGSGLVKKLVVKVPC